MSEAAQWLQPYWKQRGRQQNSLGEQLKSRYRYQVPLIIPKLRTWARSGFFDSSQQERSEPYLSRFFRSGRAILDRFGRQRASGFSVPVHQRTEAPYGSASRPRARRGKPPHVHRHCDSQRNLVLEKGRLLRRLPDFSQCGEPDLLAPSRLNTSYLCSRFPGVAFLVVSPSLVEYDSLSRAIRRSDSRLSFLAYSKNFHPK